MGYKRRGGRGSRRRGRGGYKSKTVKVYRGGIKL